MRFSSPYPLHGRSLGTYDQQDLKRRMTECAYFLSPTLAERPSRSQDEASELLHSYG
jgi:hypothetical protein